MNETDVLTGIKLASCRDELSAFLDMVQLSLDKDQCWVDDWELITELARIKIGEFEARVFH